MSDSGRVVVTDGPTRPPRDGAGLKVSVIVPTFRSGPALLDTLAALDAQVLPADEFEVILVDDGSPDDTYARTSAYAADRANATAVRIENTGWPCLPRNLGIELARGEYVLFCDHDDLIGPRTLSDGYALGSRAGADAVNLKETRTGRPTWGLYDFDADHDDLPLTSGRNPLGPMTPHKLYRRQLLRDHGIRFPTGPGRVMGEDVHFNIDVLAHAGRVAMLTSSDPYHWVIHGTNSSTDYHDDARAHLETMRAILEHADQALTHRPELRTTILSSFLSSTVLPAKDTAVAAKDWLANLDLVRSLVERFAGPEVEARMRFRPSAALHLLRTGQAESVPDLLAVDRGLTARASAAGIRWDSGRLVVDAEVGWGRPDGSGPDGGGPALLNAGGRPQVDVGTPLAELIPERLRDVGDRLGDCGIQLAVRRRADHAVWPVEPMHDGLSATATPDLRRHWRALVDPAGPVRDGMRDGEVWEVLARVEYLHGHQVRPVQAPETPRLPAIVDGRVVIAYRTRAGSLAIDVGETYGDVVRDGAPALDRATWARSATGWTLAIPLTGVHVSGRAVLPASARLRSGEQVVKTSARVVAADDAALLEIDVPRRVRGAWRLVVRTPGGRRLTLGDLVVPRLGPRLLPPRLLAGPPRGR